MRILLFVAVSALCAYCHAEPAAQATAAQVPIRGPFGESEAMLKATGGRIIKPGTQKGEIVYVNCQSAANRKWLEESALYFRKESRFNIAVKDGAFDLKRPQIRGDVSLFVIDDPEMPAVLCAPQDRWAMVNVASLKTDKEPFFKARVAKQLTRGFALLCGASNSQYAGSLVGGVADVADLDKHVESRLPIDVLARFPAYMKPFGVTPGVLSNYRAACQQGWAPAPTNEYQKIIWEKVKAEANAKPSNPMKITKEKK